MVLQFWIDRSGWNYLDQTELLVMIVVGSALFPVGISLLTGGKSFFYMLVSFIPYYLFLPTLVASFGSYAFARTFDLTWGNRPPSAIKEEDSAGQQRKEAIMRAQEKLQEQSQASCGFIVMINLVVILVILMSDNLAMLFLLLSGVVFLWSGVQMILSFFWFLQWSIWRVLHFMWRFVCLCHCTYNDYDYV